MTAATQQGCRGGPAMGARLDRANGVTVATRWDRRDGATATRWDGDGVTVAAA